MVNTFDIDYGLPVCLELTLSCYRGIWSSRRSSHGSTDYIDVFQTMLLIHCYHGYGSARSD